MAKLSCMNGKPFIYFTFTDFGTPGRRTDWGRHTTFNAGLSNVKKISKLHAMSTSNVWLEDKAGNVVGGRPPVISQTTTQQQKP